MAFELEDGEQLHRVWKLACQNYRLTAQSPIAGNIHDIRYLALALGNEAGECQGVIKKQWRGDFGDGVEWRSKAIDELADTVNYAMMLAHELDLSPSHLLDACERKLSGFADKVREPADA